MIKTLFLDVDGTLTDGFVYMSESGEAFKAFNVKDGFGLSRVVKENHILPIIITGRNSDILTKRCEELGINRIYQNTKDKKHAVAYICEQEGINAAESAYMGDDLNDKEAMLFIAEAGGLTGCPADAESEIKALCTFVSSKDGGKGAVREFINYLIQTNCKSSN